MTPQPPRFPIAAQRGAAISTFIAGRPEHAGDVAVIFATMVVRPGSWMNRYEIAVASGMPAAEVVGLAEAMAGGGVLRTRGPADRPNLREYSIG